MRIVREGVGLGYEQEGTGPDCLLFIHGAFSDRSTFTEQFAYFVPRGFRVVAVDLRGHGESDKPEQDYTIAGYADDILWMVGELEMATPVIIGQSLGGMVAVEAVGARKAGRAAITLDSPSVIPGWTQKHPGRFDAQMQGPDFKAVLRGFLLGAFLPVDDQERLRQGLDRIENEVPEYIIKGDWDAMMRWDPRPALEGLDEPFLFLDNGQPDVDLDLLRSYCPQLVYGKTVGAGHRALQDVPDQVNAMLNQFIKYAPELADYYRANQGSLKYPETSK